MKNLTRLLVFIVLIMNLSAWAQLKVTRLVGEQIRDTADGKTELICIPLKISSTMKIVAVTGNNKGFWIQKESETVFKFIEVENAVGLKLKPGTYYAYPYFKDNALKAKVEVLLK